MKRPLSIPMQYMKCGLLTLTLSLSFLESGDAFAGGRFDGRWSGVLNATDSLMGCTGSVFPLELRITDGKVTGTLRLPVGGAHTLRGTVVPAGEITVTATNGRSHARSATTGMTALQFKMTGKLTGQTGKGEWSSNILGDCDGEFELYRR